jgi:hypothetical protein
MDTQTEHKSRLFSGYPLLIILLGVIVRLLPLADAQRLFRQYPTDGGFQMLSIARNLGMGLGLSTADGTIATNGVQPLITFVWGFVYLLVGGDKTLGVMLVQLVETGVALISTVFLFRLCRFLVQDRDYPDALPAWVAAIWFTSPQAVRHTQLGLETGPYILAIIVVVLYYIRICQTNADQFERNAWIKMGLLVGLAFWIRHDAVFLASTLFLVHLVPTLNSGRDAIKTALQQLAYAGLSSSLVMAPWLIYNKIKFGGILPVSGQSQMIGWGRSQPI